MNSQEISKEKLRQEMEKLLEQIRKESDLRDYYAELEKKTAQKIEELLKNAKELNERLKKME